MQEESVIMCAKFFSSLYEINAKFLTSSEIQCELPLFQFCVSVFFKVSAMVPTLHDSSRDLSIHEEGLRG